MPRAALALAFTVLPLVAACATATDEPGRTTMTLPTTTGERVVISGQRAPEYGEIRHTVTGRVTGIDRNDGQVRIRTPEGSELRLKLTPVAAATVREGDQASVDVTITPTRR
jgi:hypothetical protein